MLANEALFQRMREKFGAVYNSSWASARELALQQEEAEAAKRKEELKQRQAEARALYEASLKAAKR